MKFYTSVGKGLKLKVKVLGANSYIWRSYRGKTGRGAFLPPILNRVNDLIKSLTKYKNHKNIYSVILFWVKKVVKKGVLRNWGFGFSLRLCKGFSKVNFLGDFGWFFEGWKKKDFKRCYGKMCGLFPCIPFLRGLYFSFFWLKKYYGMRGLGFAIKLFQRAL